MIYNHYVRWGRQSVWKGIFDALAEEDEDSLVLIDASIVKAHRTAAGSKKSLTEGIKVLVDHATASQVRFTPL